MNRRAIPVFVDVRSLQDPNYQFRGVGFHTSALLRRAFTQLDGRVSIIGLIDETLGEIPEENRCYLHALHSHFNPNLTAGPVIFINPSPMTHDPVLTARFLRHGKVLSAAVVYDFIPFDRWGYFVSEAEKSDYFGSLHWLKLHDHFLPISRYSATRLQEICGVERERITVTGAPVRTAFYEVVPIDGGDQHELLGRDRNRPSTPYFILVAGEERRKNTETVVRAMSRLNAWGNDVHRLKIVGNYTADYQKKLRRLYKNGNPNVIEFLSGIDDKKLALLYCHAVATIAASYVEGFSLPIAEAIACGCPVIASQCEAHAELISQKEALFAPDDIDELANKLALFTNRAHRSELAAFQSVIKYQFHEQFVAERFWQSILHFWEARFQRPLRYLRKSDTKPTIALLTPYPPDESGVARYSRQTVLAAERFLNIDVYTNDAQPTREPNALDRVAGSMSIEPFLRNKYDAVISVLGNSKFHANVFDLFEKLGGPCVLHDSRYTQFYFERLGQEGFLQLAKNLLGREVNNQELHGWLLDRDLPTLFLEPIIKKADPLIVHTEKVKKLIAERYGVDAVCLPFAATMRFDDTDISTSARMAAKRRLGIDPHQLMISSFGYTHFNKGSLECVMALDQLRAWKIPAVLYFVGANLVSPHITELAHRLGVSDYVHCFSGFLDDDVYREYMSATDVAIQLRTYGFGQPSGALMECISAGLPTVANEDLADSCEAPFYVRRVPDHLSPLLVAEAIGDIFEKTVYQNRLSEERLSFCAKHNFEHYAEQLAKVLKLECGSVH